MRAMRRFRSSRDMLDATLQVAVSEECDGEVRRITLHNRSARPRTIELTSYAELVLGPAAADASHPAFSKMFVQTHWDAGSQVLLATRRKRTPADTPMPGQRISSSSLTGPKMIA